MKIYSSKKYAKMQCGRFASLKYIALINRYYGN